MKPHMAASLVRLIYASRVTEECGPEELQEILDVSRRNNAAAGITGALCYSGRGFLQCLEGPRTAINEVYRRIVRDTRNEDVTLLAYAPIKERAFGQWSMAYMQTDRIGPSILGKHGVTQSLDPYSLNAEQALSLLKDVARERAAERAGQKNAPGGGVAAASRQTANPTDRDRAESG